MRLPLYFFRQYLPSFFFGVALFTFVFLLDKTFDLIDLILNKGVQLFTVVKLFALFLPTALPLALPMALVMGCMVTFGRLSEDNEVTAVRASGISLLRVLWVFPAFALLVSIALLPFNSQVAPWINRSFRLIYEQIIHADPLVKIEPKSFFSIKNVRIYATALDTDDDTLRDLFVYQLPGDNRPAERIFARTGKVETSGEEFRLILSDGQLQRYDAVDPRKLLHTTFKEYVITIPLKLDNDFQSKRFRHVPSSELRKLIDENDRQGFPTAKIEAELNLRIALAFAPFALMMVGIPLATALKRGGRAFNVGISLVIIFVYYLALIFGLTLAEKSILPAVPALWIGNAGAIALGAFLFRRMIGK